MKHTADEAIVKENRKQTFTYRLASRGHLDSIMESLESACYGDREECDSQVLDCD